MTTPTPVPPAFSDDDIQREVNYHALNGRRETAAMIRTLAAELQSLRERVEAFASHTDDISGNSYLNWRLQLGELAKEMRAAIDNGAKESIDQRVCPGCGYAVLASTIDAVRTNYSCPKCGAYRLHTFTVKS